MADSKILTRIKALLAKANGTDNQHEAEVFLAKAQELLQEHQLDSSALDDVDDPIEVGRVAFTAAAKPPSWHKNLFIAVGCYYGCQVAISTRIERNKNGVWQQIKDVELFASFPSTHSDYTTFYYVRKVFLAFYEASLPADRVAEMATALSTYPELPRVQEMLTTLARMKVLRSRRVRGQTFYEVNY